MPDNNNTTEIGKPKTFKIGKNKGESPLAKYGCSKKYKKSK
tara:strand:+ start:246 stop:368 length:123 start_codon:yes stop_codon:yes gene_type:complete